MTKEQKERLQELTHKMRCVHDFTEDDYEEYLRLDAIRHCEYRQENEGRLIAFFDEHIKGKSWSEINPEDWDFYSDYHKDVYGYRPKQTAYFGKGETK